MEAYALNNQRYYQYLLSAGHLCADFNKGALSALLPFLIAIHNLDYAAAASLVMFSNLIGSIVQPIFGHLADKKNVPWTMALGVILAGGGMSITGYVGDFTGLCIAIVISGIGVSMFHPTAALLANKSAPKNQQGNSISIFSFGGNLGFTLGPIITTAAITIFGIKGTIILMIPVLIEAAALLQNNSHFKKIAESESSMSKTIKATDQVDDWRTFYKICGIIFGRSIIFYGANTFLALYWIHNLNQSEIVGNAVLTFFYALGAFSTLFGGRIADKFGHAKIIRLSFLTILPSILIFYFAASPILSIISVIPIGLAIGLCYSPIVVTGQNSLPNHKGLASGITLGLSVSIGGIFAPILGTVANNFGLENVFLIIAGVSLIPLTFAFLLKNK